MIVNGLREFSGKRVLMLQGPVGPFFARLAADLALAGATVFKVNFNGGDWLFSKSRSFSRVFDYAGDLAAWPAYFEDLLARLNIETVLLFGDCRPVHAAAMDVIQRRGVHLGVFEEGYLRPDYITLERDGVNNNSSLPSDPGFYLAQPPRKLPESKPLGRTYWESAKWGMMYFLAATVGRVWFRHYRHHRRLGISDAPTWWLSYLRKAAYRHIERDVLPTLVGVNSGNFFLVSLQMRGDAQMSVHSPYKSVQQFIEHVVTSFAQHAPASSMLALKHHPLDRGYTDYRRLIKRLIREHKLEERCFYIHDQHLPTLLEHACGVVVVNSTVGLSAVGQGVPVKLCGESIYDIQGLTFQGPLDAFWDNAHLAVPNPALYQAFRSYLIAHTQHQGSFYKRLKGVPYDSVIVWADHGSSAPHWEHRGKDNASELDQVARDLGSVSNDSFVDKGGRNRLADTISSMAAWAGGTVLRQSAPKEPHNDHQ
jgi:capsular polysaccharide export protein